MVMEEKKFTPIMKSVSQSFIYRSDTPLEEIIKFIRSSLDGVERAEIIIKHIQVSNLVSENPVHQYIH